MWLLILLGLLNAGMSITANYFLHFSALDITPVSMAVLVMNGYNPITAALVMVFAYVLPSPKEFRFLWITLPAAILIGYLAMVIPSIVILLFVYHTIGFVSSFLFGYFNPKYAAFMVVNFSVNFVLGKFLRVFFL